MCYNEYCLCAKRRRGSARELTRCGTYGKRQCLRTDMLRHFVKPEKREKLERTDFMGMIFETHAHYNDEAFQEDREEIFAQFPGKGIGRVVNIASDLQSIGECLDLAHRYPFMYCALGIHPSDCAPLTDELLEEIRGKLSDPRVVAVGEIGLDYYWDTPDRAIQKHWFEEQLEMARRAKLPVVIHSRDAAQDTMQLMRDHRAEEIGGVVHCYSYSLEMAREFVKMGFYIGIGGPVTHKNNKKTRKVLKNIGIDHVLVETDSPYMAPEEKRGEQNTSLNIKYVIEKIADELGMSESVVIEITSRNACGSTGWIIKNPDPDHKNPG